MLSKIMKTVSAIIAAAGTVVCVTAADRYEAQDAIVNESATPRVALTSASGGYYVQMREGELNFTNVTVPAADFYTIWASYSQTCDSRKLQNLVINGTPQGEINFPATNNDYNVAAETCGPMAFERRSVASKIKLNAGANTIRITKGWGWVDLDYIEITPFEDEPFDLKTTLVTPNASDNAKKMFQFLREKFQKKVISGVMTSTVMRNTGGYEPNSIDDQMEMSHVKTASGKFPAMMGLDFIHGTGEQPNRPGGAGDWFVGYNNATIALAEEFFNKGGIPIYCWHWRDPLRNSTNDGSFYTQHTTFDLTKAFTDNTYDRFNESSPEYIAMLNDIDEVAGFLKRLADKDIPVLWRPVHEAAGGWFWWGAKGPKPLAQLWRLIFDRMVNHHKLNNLIWVWTTEESGPDMDGGWYPGDEYTDIIGRDWYPPEDQTRKMHGSLVKNFENIKGIFGTDKIIALAENGPVPHPDSLVNDGAYWSWFMAWDRHFTTQVNTQAEWSYIMNHDYVITLEDMPGWANYGLVSVFTGGAKTTSGTAVRTPAAVVRGKTLRVTSFDNSDLRIRMINVQGRTVRTFKTKGSADLPLKNIPAGRYFVEIKKSGKKVSTSAVTVK